MNTDLPIKEAIVLRPGDHCLVSIVDHGDPVDRFEEMQQQLRERFPGVEFTFIAGASAMAVQRAENRS